MKRWTKNACKIRVHISRKHRNAHGWLVQLGNPKHVVWCSTKTEASAMLLEALKRLEFSITPAKPPPLAGDGG